VEKELILLVGPIGAGKTTFSKTLENDAYIRISQDEMGRKAYLTHFKHALKEGIPRIIIDRMNFNRDQRKRFIEPAREAGYCVTVFEFKTNRATCIERVIKRKGHPTVESDNIKLAEEIMNMYHINYESIAIGECDNYNEVKE